MIKSLCKTSNRNNHGALNVDEVTKILVNFNLHPAQKDGQGCENQAAYCEIADTGMYKRSVTGHSADLTGKCFSIYGGIQFQTWLQVLADSNQKDLAGILARFFVHVFRPCKPHEDVADKIKLPAAAV